MGELALLAGVVPHEAAYVAGGYALTAIGLGGYLVSLDLRARRARRRVAAAQAKRGH